MLKQILKRDKFEKMESDKKDIENKIKKFNDIYSNGLKDEFNFKVYGIDIILKNLNKNTIINNLMLERLDQFNKNITSSNIVCHYIKQ